MGMGILCGVILLIYFLFKKKISDYVLVKVSKESDKEHMGFKISKSIIINLVLGSVLFLIFNNMGLNNNITIIGYSITKVYMMYLIFIGSVLIQTFYFGKTLIEFLIYGLISGIVLVFMTLSGGIVWWQILIMYSINSIIMSIGAFMTKKAWGFVGLLLFLIGVGFFFHSYFFIYGNIRLGLLSLMEMIK